MTFDISGKIALVTGGGSGLGLEYAKEMLRNGLGGVTLADINEEIGKSSEKELNNTYGTGKALFVKTDVTKYNEFEDAFKKTIEQFKNVDLLINNAGIMNDGIWEKEVDINMKGTINGILLGMENYLKNYRRSEEAMIVNIASVCGVKGYGYMPIYCGTKFAINGMTLGWATHYQHSKVKVISFCPGSTKTPLLELSLEKVISPHYYEVDEAGIELIEGQQEPHTVAEQLVRVVKEADNGTIWISEYSRPAYQYIFPTRRLLVQ